MNIQSLTWGIPSFDIATNGIPLNDLSVVETPDYHSGQIILGHYLYSGLQKGETCVLITFDTATTFLENFLLWNLDFESYLESKQLLIMNFKPNISNEVGLTHQYDELFDEIKRLSGGKEPQRIAIQQIDTLMNLNNNVLMNISAQKLNAAANGKSTKATSILGQFVQFGDDTHKELSVTLQKTISGFFSLKLPKEDQPFRFQFNTKKLPWFSYNHHPVTVNLNEGEGFIIDSDKGK